MRVVCMELRKRVRYRLRANAVFTWEGVEHRRFRGEGATRDISLTGVFIFTLTCPPVGAAVHLEVFLFALAGGQRHLLMKTEATVIRVEHANGGEGFAVVTEGITLAEGSNR